jgi:hypothetical protein
MEQTIVTDNRPEPIGSVSTLLERFADRHNPDVDALAAAGVLSAELRSALRGALDTDLLDVDALVADPEFFAVLDRAAIEEPEVHPAVGVLRRIAGPVSDQRFPTLEAWWGTDSDRSGPEFDQ